MAHPLSVLDTEVLQFSEGSLLIMNITIALIMFGVALEINLDNFRNIVKNPKSVIVGIVSQFILLPAVTFLFILLLKPTPSVALGMILVAACPGGNISNFISLLSKGNIALSVSLTAFATVAAIFMTPLNFYFWGSLYKGASGLIMPVSIDVKEMALLVFIILGIPLAAGILFAKKFPNITKNITKPMKIFSILAFAGYVVAALSANFELFLKHIHLIILIVLAHNALALLSGFSLGSLFRLPESDKRSITIETGIQNSGLALVIIFSPKFFNGLGGMAFIAAWWGIWHILAGLTISFFWSRKKVRN